MSSTNRSNEIWSNIKGFDNYKVSNYGRVVNKSTNYELTPSVRKNYFRVALYDSQGGHWQSVHRLVAEAFIPNPNNMPQINHKDGNKQNNYVENLEWCNNSHNQLHAWRTGLQHRTAKHEKQIAKLTELNKRTKRTLSNEQVLFIRKNYVKGNTTYKYFADLFGVSQKTIEMVVKYKRYKEVV